MNGQEIFNSVQELVESFTGELTREEVLNILLLVGQAMLGFGRWAERNNMPDPTTGEEALALLLKCISDKTEEDGEFLEKLESAINSIDPSIERLKDHHGWQDETDGQEEAGDE